MQIMGKQVCVCNSYASPTRRPHVGNMQAYKQNYSYLLARVLCGFLSELNSMQVVQEPNNIGLRNKMMILLFKI